MISYDWQQRLKNDCEDFIENKIPQGDYDFEIIYNAYPDRIDSEMPQAVITFVAKELRKRIAKKPDKYMKFLEYIQKNKGINGEKIFNMVMQKIMLLNPEKYDEMLINLLKKTEKKTSLKKIFDNIVFPLVKKFSEKQIDKLFEWLRENPTDIMIENIFKMFNNYLKANPKKAQEIFEKCESYWNSENQYTKNGNVMILKMLFRIDKNLYRNIYLAYKSTYNPNFIEILAAAVSENSEIIRQCIEKWDKSGNVKIKKSATIAKRNLAKTGKRK